MRSLEKESKILLENLKEFQGQIDILENYLELLEILKA